MLDHVRGGDSPLPLMDNSSEVAYNLTPLTINKFERSYSETLSQTTTIESTESEFHYKSEV